jgi:hypothetical protein
MGRNVLIHVIGCYLVHCVQKCYNIPRFNFQVLLDVKFKIMAL